MWLTEIGRLITDIISEHGRRRIDSLLENGEHALASGAVNLSISIEDTITVSEFTEFLYPDHEINSFDLITSSEVIICEIAAEALNVHDTITISEVAFGQITGVTVNEDVTIIEDILLTLFIQFSVKDNVLVSEWDRVSAITLFVEAYDAILITESVSLLDLVVEVGVVSDTVAVTSVVDLSLDVLFTHTVSDHITVLDAVQGMSLDILNYSVHDLITSIVSFVVMDLEIAVADSFEDITVVEDYQYNTGTIMEGQDSIAIAETIQMFLFAPPTRGRKAYPVKKTVNLYPRKRTIKLYPREGVLV